MRVLDGTHVLLVDDDPDSLFVFTKVMEYQGALVIALKTAKEALGVLGALRADVLVTDINMPENDGFWLLAQARRRGLDMPAVAVSALGQHDTPRILKAGFHQHLIKPVDPNVLCKTVQTAARGRGQ